MFFCDNIKRRRRLERKYKLRMTDEDYSIYNDQKGPRVASAGARPAEAPPENYTWAPLSANKVNRKNYTKCDCVQFCVYVP